MSVIPQAKENQQGLTLIELILVIAIASIVTLLATPFYARFYTQNAVANLTDQLTSSLRKAQFYSMIGKQGGSWGVKYTMSPKQITLFLVGNSAFDENFTVGGNTTISGFSQVTFAHATGLPDVAPIITISGDSNTKTIIVNSQGIVSK